MDIEDYQSRQMLGDMCSCSRYHSHHVSIVAVEARMRATQDRSTKGHDLPVHTGASPLKRSWQDSVLQKHVSIGWEVLDQV